MTDEILESGQGAGSEGTTNSNASQPAGDERPSQFNADELLVQLRATIKEEVGKATQSTKDKRFSEIEKKLGDFQPVLERVGALMKDGKSFDEAQREIEWDEMRKAVFGGQAQPSAEQSTGNTPPPAVDVAKAFAMVGLDLNDPQVSVAMKKNFQTEDEAIAAGVRLSKQLASSPAPTPAQGAAMQGGQPQADNVEEKTQKYIQDVQAARGNATKIRQLREQAVKDGVPTWNIDFS